MNGTNDTAEAGAARTMGEISHTNPHTGETAGHLFRRGPVVAADGGREAAEADGRGADDETQDGSDADANGRTMRDVSHTPPNGSEDANRVFERGRNHVEDGRSDE